MATEKTEKAAPPEPIVEAVSEETFTLELDPAFNGVQLQVGNEYVELTSANSSYETTDKPGYNAVKFVTGVKQAAG